MQTLPPAHAIGEARTNSSQLLGYAATLFTCAGSYHWLTLTQFEYFRIHWSYNNCISCCRNIAISHKWCTEPILIIQDHDNSNGYNKMYVCASLLAITYPYIIVCDRGLPCRMKNMTRGIQLLLMPERHVSTQHGLPWSNPIIARSLIAFLSFYSQSINLP